jgi:hypothetical protein
MEKKPQKQNQMSNPDESIFGLVQQNHHTDVAQKVAVI